MKVKRKAEKQKDKIIKLLRHTWIMLFLLLTIAFSGYADNLGVESQALMQSHIYDYVYITNMSIKGSSGASSINYSHLDHEFKANIQAPTCNSYVTYQVNIINTTPYKAFITSTSILSQVNGQGVNTNTLSVEFIGVTPNETYINPHSTKSIDVKIYNNCSGSDESVIIKPAFEYSLYKYFDLTVNSVNPNDGNVSLTTTEGTFTGTSTVTHRVMEGETVSYKVNRKYYYESQGTYTMGTEDHTIDVTLTPDPHRDLTINTNVTSSTIVVKQDGSIVCSGTGNLVCSVESAKNVTVTVDEPEYYYTESGGTYYGYEETFTMPATETTKTVNLTERPWITGTISNTNRTSAKTKTSTNWHDGYYLIEAWGGKGGTATGDGGSEGYIYGVVYVPYNSYVYSTAGGSGTSADGATGGANGGGNATDNTMNRACGSGGGYSAFAIDANAINTTNVNNGKIKLIAAGGGGGTGRGGSITSQHAAGGNGGSLTTTKKTITAGSVFSGTNGGTGRTGGIGGAGSTTGGTNSNDSDCNGSAFQGGITSGFGGAGGGGYFGGAGGSGLGGISTGPGGGGGGSSFIANGVTYSGLPSSVTSKLTSSNPSSTGGAVKIQWVGKNL